MQLNCDFFFQKKTGVKFKKKQAQSKKGLLLGIYGSILCAWWEIQQKKFVKWREVEKERGSAAGSDSGAAAAIV